MQSFTDVAARKNAGAERSGSETRSPRSRPLNPSVDDQRDAIIAPLSRTDRGQPVTHTPEAPRAKFVRLQWRAIAQQAAGRPIALYGGGRHTRWMLDRLKLHSDGSRITAILDDEPRSRTAIAGISLRKPAEIDPASVAIVVVSSESIEDQLTRRATAWAERAPDGARPTIVRLYERLPHGPYNASHDAIFESLAATGGGATNIIDTPSLSDDDVGEFSVLKRIPHAPRRTATDTLPVPPDGLRSGYDGSDINYLSRGRSVARNILEIIERNGGFNSDGPRDILEWGCSSGRVLRHFLDLTPNANCWGCDIDDWTINWAAGHLSPPLRFFRSTTSPSLPIESNSFDLVYAISVFTHLSDHFDAWLMELRRILRPGGYLFASINDEHVWQRLSRNPNDSLAERCPRLDFSRPLEVDFITHGLGPHAQSFWHAQGVRRRWSFAFDVLEITPGCVDGGQTGVLLRKPAR